MISGTSREKGQVSMKEFVIGVLSDPNVTAAIAGILSAALLAFGTWVKNKVSPTALINEWWEYIHPLRDAALAQAQKAVDSGAWDSQAARSIVAQTLAALGDVYRKNEDGEPSKLLLSAVSKEIETAIAKVAAK